MTRRLGIALATGQFYTWCNMGPHCLQLVQHGASLSTAGATWGLSTDVATWGLTVYSCGNVGPHCLQLWQCGVSLPKAVARHAAHGASLFKLPQPMHPHGASHSQRCSKPRSCLGRHSFGRHSKGTWYFRHHTTLIFYVCCSLLVSSELCVTKATKFMFLFCL
jgi:hypothetical protein